jgi:hypothetical protein
MKNSPAQDYADERLAEEINALCEEKEFAEAIAEAFGNYRIPVNENTVGQTVSAMKMFEELEEISDDVCARFLREGIAPTLENLHTLRFEKEGPAMAAGTHVREGEQALAWEFPESEEAEDEEILRKAGLATDEFSRQMLNWLKEKRIYVSTSNLQMLNDLWTLSLPFETKEAAEFAAKNLRRGIKPCEGLVIQRESSEGRTQSAPAKADSANSAEEEHLHAMEKMFRKLYVETYGVEQCLNFEFTEYRKCLEEAEETEHYLIKYDLPVTVDHLSSFGRLLSQDGIFPILKNLLGEKELLALYEDAAMDEPHCEKVLKTLWESFEKAGDTIGLSDAWDYVTAQKTLMLMLLLEEKGFFEVPMKEGDNCLRVRVRREKEDGFTAVMEDESIGGLSLRYRKTDDGITLLAVGSREKTLEELKERTKGKVSLTTLYSPEFPYGRNFF